MNRRTSEPVFCWVFLFVNVFRFFFLLIFDFSDGNKITQISEKKKNKFFLFFQVPTEEENHLYICILSKAPDDWSCRWVSSFPVLQPDQSESKLITAVHRTQPKIKGQHFFSKPCPISTMVIGHMAKNNIKAYLHVKIMSKFKLELVYETKIYV